MNTKGFLGTGIAFPLAVEPKTGRLATVSFEEDIRQAIAIILKTHEGERVMNPNFGARVMDFVFESDAQDFAVSVTKEVERVLIQWEPRITEIHVISRIDPANREQAVVEVSYMVRSTNNYFNLVYPFHLLEGVGV